MMQNTGNTFFAAPPADVYTQNDKNLIARGDLLNSLKRATGVISGHIAGIILYAGLVTGIMDRPKDFSIRKIIPGIFILLFLNFYFSTRVRADVLPESKNKLTISGFVKDQSSGEVLIGATVFVSGLKTGAVTNAYGFYSLSLPAGSYLLRYSFVGFETVEKMITLNKNVILTIELFPVAGEIGEVVVAAKGTSQNVIAPEMSIMKIDTRSIARIPAFMGETDLLKVMQLMPGVQSTSEGSTGFSVRGGNADQNLIILDEATVYNASHLMGFFSVFNNDAVKDLTLYKGDIPAAYGGRLSSLVDVRMRDGNSNRFLATGGVGTISSKLTLEGPLVKDQSTFLLSGRRTYADLFLPLSKNEDIRDSKLYFYDLNLKISHRFNDENRIFLSAYSGRDVFKNRFARMDFGNQTASLRWNHLFSAKLFFNLSLIYSLYNYNLGAMGEDEFSFLWTSHLRDYSVRADFTRYFSVGNTLRFGATSIYHRFSPGAVTAVGTQNLFNGYNLPGQYALEHSLYASGEISVFEKLVVKAGFRLAMFQNTGPGLYYVFDGNHNPVDSIRYNRGDLFHTYSQLEPRLAITLPVNENASFKGSFSHTAQFLMLAQNSSMGTPYDIWFPATPNVKPQTADQMAVGFFRNSPATDLEFSAEVYYKAYRNVIDFKDHFQLLLNKYLEGELRTGKGVSYGFESMIRKSLGRLSGWLSYTFSRSFRTIPEINDGRKYNAPFDKPHTINVVASYEIGKRLTTSLTWVYNTGMPVTFPTGRAIIGNTLIPVYSGRNEYRLPDYHRLDLSLVFRNKNKPGRKWHSEWNLSVYNAYNRHNAWAINFEQEESDPNVNYAVKTYLFSVIPALTYNFRF